MADSPDASVLRPALHCSQRLACGKPAQPQVFALAAPAELEAAVRGPRRLRINRFPPMWRLCRLLLSPRRRPRGREEVKTVRRSEGSSLPDLRVWSGTQTVDAPSASVARLSM